jgi:hypothetical protein
MGCTLNFLLVGRDPEALTVSQPSLVLPNINPKLDGLIQQCTALEAAARPESAAAVAHTLRDLEKIAV